MQIITESLIKQRRAGATFNELITNILNKTQLLQEYRFLDILINVGFSKDMGHLDMSTDQWGGLPVEKQIEYAKDYQLWYALELGLPIEKLFPITDSVGITMRFIPPGTYLMGNVGQDDNLYKETPEKIEILKPFWCEKYELCQRVWESVMGYNPSHFQGMTNPVESVRQQECADFCEKTKFSLLSRAEWEYACRAGTTTSYSFGNSSHELTKYAWYLRNSNHATHPIGEKLSNAWGLYDMHGNVYEWTRDLSGNHSHSYIICGGGCESNFERCVSAFREEEDRDSLNYDIGFRVCLKI